MNHFGLVLMKASLPRVLSDKGIFMAVLQWDFVNHSFVTLAVIDMELNGRVLLYIF